MSWVETLAWVLAVVLLLPIFTSGSLRYYACYVLYTVYASLITVLVVPSACLLPRDPIAIRNASKIARYLTIPLGITWEIRNEKKLKYGQKAVVVANHQSILDILGIHVLNELAGTMTVLAAKKLLYFFPWGPASWIGGLIFIDRGNPKSTVEASSRATELVKRGIKVWVFPEGTRNGNTDDLLPFKKGAFHLAVHCQVPIIPLVYSPYYFIDHKNKTFKKGKVIVSVLDEIPVEGLTKDDVNDLIDRTRERMREEYKRLCLEIECAKQEQRSAQ